jgi:hypothetical protein
MVTNPREAVYNKAYKHVKRNRGNTGSRLYLKSEPGSPAGTTNQNPISKAVNSNFLAAFSSGASCKEGKEEYNVNYAQALPGAFHVT